MHIFYFKSLRWILYSHIHYFINCDTQSKRLIYKIKIINKLIFRYNFARKSFNNVSMMVIAKLTTYNSN